METREELQQMLADIDKWEREQKDLWFWEKLGRLPFVLLDTLTPSVVHEKLGTAIDELYSFLETGGRYLVEEQTVLKRFSSGPKSPDVQQSPVTLEQVSRMPLKRMDAVAAGLAESRVRFAAIQGATTGLGGLFTLAIDIPLLLGTTLKVISETAIAFGYDPSDKRERLFIVKVLQFQSSDIVGKQAILATLSDYDEPAVQREQVMAELQGWREVMVTYTENFGWKKLFQMVPVAGIVFGSYINRKAIEETAETARMLYKKRRARERLRGELPRHQS